MTRLFVDNLPTNTTKGDLQYLFGQFGIVNRVQFRNRSSRRDKFQAIIELVRGDVDLAVRMLNRDLYDGAALSVRLTSSKA
jgi:RNA recognition motif-containing protein